MATARKTRHQPAAFTNGQVGLPSTPTATEHLDIAALETWLWDAACAVKLSG